MADDKVKEGLGEVYRRKKEKKKKQEPIINEAIKRRNAQLEELNNYQNNK